MKTKMLLLVDADPHSTEVISVAAARTGHQVTRAHTSREAFCIMEHGLDDLDLIVIDVDPGVHGIDVLETVEISSTTPPVIVLTDVEDHYLPGFATARGAAACVTKPFTADEIAAVIEEVSAPAWRSAGCTCDAWGHPHRDQPHLYPCPSCRRHTQPAPTELECANI
ncbi:MAG: response regulator [Chthoniobacterales bacterium]